MEVTYDKERDIIVLRKPYKPMIYLANIEDFEDWEKKTRDLRVAYDALPWWKRLLRKRP